MVVAAGKGTRVTLDIWQHVCLKVSDGRLYRLIYCLLYSACFLLFFFFSSRRRHTRFDCDWSSDVCSSDLICCVQLHSESWFAIATPCTSWRCQPSMTWESCVQIFTRLRGTSFSQFCAIGGSAYSSRTVTLRDRYSTGLRSTFE